MRVQLMEIGKKERERESKKKRLVQLVAFKATYFFYRIQKCDFWAIMNMKVDAWDMNKIRRIMHEAKSL